MNESASSPTDISQQSDYIVLQISQEAIQNCDTSEYVALLVLQTPYNRLKQHSRGMYS